MSSPHCKGCLLHSFGTRFSSEHAILWSEYIMTNLEGVSNEHQASVSESVIQDVAQQIGISRLKPKQMEAILAFLSGKDVFVTLPTGYGKSIIFALLPAVFNRIRGKLCTKKVMIRV